MKAAMHGDHSIQTLLQIIKEKHNNVFTLWNNAFAESNKISSANGLAPRCSKLGMITGSVLHCMMALERSVATRKLSERSLKIIRVETSNDGKRLVGMKYPIDNEALSNLRVVMKTLNAARNVSSCKGQFSDEFPGPIQAKSVAWLTSPPKTMESFFTTTAKKRKETAPPSTKRITPLPNEKKMNKNFVPKKKQKTGQTKTITSFFRSKSQFS